MSFHKPGCVAQRKVFRAEMTRRLVQDCMDVVEHMGTARPDVRFRVTPIDYDATEIVWAEVTATTRDGGLAAEGVAYITPGTPRAGIYADMQKAVDMLDAALQERPVAA